MGYESCTMTTIHCQKKDKEIKEAFCRTIAEYKIHKSFSFGRLDQKSHPVHLALGNRM